MRISKHRHDQGKKYVFDHNKEPGFGITSHFREGPRKPRKDFKDLGNPWEPTPIKLFPPKVVCPGIEVPVIEEPDAGPSHSVPDGGATFALLGSALLVLVALRRRFKA